jgi:hypothetical protein
MKKPVIFLIALLVSASLFAQADTSAHLAFKGVPIDGTIARFVGRMKKCGFTRTLVKSKDKDRDRDRDKNRGGVTLAGDFAGYENCVVKVETSGQPDLVSRITVHLYPKSGSIWDNYYSMKGMRREKYGEPADSDERYDQFDEAIAPGSHTFYTVWETAKGTIWLSSRYAMSTGRYMQLEYTDRINSGKVRAEAMKDL